MNPYCKKTEGIAWAQWQSGFALGRAAKDSGCNSISTRYISIPFQRGFHEGYYGNA